MAVLLEAKGLTKYFGKLCAVNNVDYSIEEGRTYGIIGPNGSGKTTFFNLLSGFHLPSDGSIQFGDSDVTYRPAHARTGMGVARTFQLVSVFGSLSVWENLVLSTLRFKEAGYPKAAPFLLRKANRGGIMEDCLAALRTVGLEEKADKPTAVLSYGDKRLLELAIVLSLRPRLLLLDEPFAGLSDHEIGFIVDLILSLKGRFTQIIIEHKISKLIELVDRLSVLHNGSIICSDLPEAVLENAEVRGVYWGQGAGHD
jgi:branched-chain amino acid transport system ATP-binding protein